MIYGRKTKHSPMPGGYFQLQNEKTKTRVVGFGYGDHIKLKDEFGNVWRGTAEKRDDDVFYHFRASDGRVLTGVSSNFMVILRDDQGETWKGFID